MREIMRPIISVEEAEELATHGYAAIRCNLIAEELQILCSEIQTLPAASGTTIHTAAMLLLKAHDEIATANRERLEVREDGDIIDGQDRPEVGALRSRHLPHPGRPGDN